MAEGRRDRAVVIANPRAGSGRVGRRLPTLEGRLAELGIVGQIMLTQHPGHAADLVKKAFDDGGQFLVVVGGDGTVHEVVNAVLADRRSIAREVVLAILAAGSGSDFARTFGLPTALDGVGRYLEEGRVRLIDTGEIVYRHARRQSRRHFVNIAEVGLGAANVARAERLPRRLGQIRYLVSFWMTLGPYRPCGVRVQVDEQSFEGISHNIVVANGRYFGGGMHISPKSDPGDGTLDVQVSIGPKRQAFTLIPSFYRGSHLPNPNIIEMSGTSVTIDSEVPLPVEADGESLGSTPVTVRVTPRSLRLLVPGPSGDAPSG